MRSRRRPGSLATHSRRESRGGSACSEFVELVARDDAPTDTAAIEVIMGGQVVRVRPGFYEATLRRLLAILSRSC